MSSFNACDKKLLILWHDPVKGASHLYVSINVPFSQLSKQSASFIAIKVHLSSVKENVMVTIRANLLEVNIKELSSCYFKHVTL